MTASALRASGRIAWRGARRNLRRSTLILLMIALPVALVAAGATVARTVIPAPADEAAGHMGAADLLVMISTGRIDPTRLESRLPDGSNAVKTRSRYTSVVAGGTLTNLTVLEPDEPVDAPVFEGLYLLQSGRAPAAAGEAALDPGLLERFGASIGDEVEIEDLELEVTGVVVAPQNLSNPIAVVGLGTLPEDGMVSTVLVDLAPGTSYAEARRAMKPEVKSFLSRTETMDVVSEDALVWEAVSLVGGALALSATGLIAAAAFVVGARRQLRSHGLLGAVGGEPRHVRAVVLLGGTSLGFVGSAGGAVAGIGIAYATHPFLDRLVGRVVGPVEISWLAVFGAIAMGTIAATLAALLPARAAARLSTIEALAGRTPPPRPPGRIAAFGLILLVGGGAVTAWATFTDRNQVLAAGLVGMLVGVLLGIPLLVSLVGKVATRLPVAGRVAARDAARHGRRTGAAVAVAVIALAIPVAVGTYSLGEETYERRSPRLGEDQLVVGRVNDSLAPSETDDLVADVEAAFPEALVVPLRRAVRPVRGAREPAPVWAQGKAQTAGPGAVTYVAWEVFVGDEDLLRALHAEDGADELAAGKAVTLGGYTPRKGVVRIGSPLRSGRSSRVEVDGVAIDSPAYFNESLPRIVISAATARELGLDVEEPSQHLLTAPEPLSEGDLAKARALAADYPGFYVSSNDDFLPKFALGRSIATAATIPLGLAILAIAVALVASESRRTHQVLVAVGAGPLTHRKVVGTTSALLALIAAVLAVPAGLLPTVVVQIASQAGRPVVVPWATIALVVAVTPLVAGLGAAAAARSPKMGSFLNPAA